MNPYMSLIADHLWQSTLFAGVAWLLTLALRRNPARVRHGLWLAAHQGRCSDRQLRVSTI